MSANYEELIEKWTYHLVNCHGDELTMEELIQEQEKGESMNRSFIIHQ